MPGAKRAQRRSQGLCIQCGRAPWREGASLCPMHREDANAVMRACYARKGQSKIKMRRHRRANADWIKKARERRRRNGRCTECGKKQVSRFRACLDCRLIDRERRKAA